MPNTNGILCFSISEDINVIYIFAFPVALVISISVILTKGIDSLLNKEIWSIVLVALITLILLLAVILIWRQPQSPTKAAFMVRNT